MMAVPAKGLQKEGRPTGQENAPKERGPLLTERAGVAAASAEILPPAPARLPVRCLAGGHLLVRREVIDRRIATTLSQLPSPSRFRLSPLSPVPAFPMSDGSPRTP